MREPVFSPDHDRTAGPLTVTGGNPSKQDNVGMSRGRRADCSQRLLCRMPPQAHNNEEESQAIGIEYRLARAQYDDDKCARVILCGLEYPDGLHHGSKFSVSNNPYKRCLHDLASGGIRNGFESVLG